MENINFTASTYIALITQSLLVCLLVVSLLILWKKRTGDKIELFLVGAVTFFVSAIILENIPKIAILSIPAVKNSTVLTYILASAFAGFFEETGRFVAFRTAMKKNHNKRNAVSYGIGHGGFEAVFVILSSVITYIVMGVYLKTGKIDELTASMDEATQQVFFEQLKGVAGVTLPEALLGVSERFSAIAIHISLSVLVFSAAKDRKRIMLFPVAILIHFGFDAVITLYQTNNVTAVQIEIILAFISLCLSICVYLYYRRLPQEVTDSERRLECNV